MIFVSSIEADASFTLTPSSWNVVGLDSNRPATGPTYFPVGAKVCSTTSVTNVPVTFTWDSANANITLRGGSSITIPSISAGGCEEAFFEVEVNKIAASFDTTRRYHISAGGASTPTPRELYVEHLISQSRNYINDVELDGVSIPAGGAMSLTVGNTYTIKLKGGTATQGYNQFESFINFPNTIFQILSVDTTYSANNAPHIDETGHDSLYADACVWENDPDSPNYLDCYNDYKTGGNNVVTTYVVKIISGGGTSETLNTLLYDFSGSSFHYNADYSTGARIANIIDPSIVTIDKNFSPDPTNVGGISVLTFTLSNPNAGQISGINFIDVFPTSPGAMVVAPTPNATTNGCGTPTYSPSAGAASVSFSGGSISANSSCIVKVNVTVPTIGTYTNTSNNLFVDLIDTGDNATDTLLVNTTPPLPPIPSSCPGQEIELARWEMPASGQGSGGPSPPYTSKASDVSTATTSYTTVSGTQTIAAIGSAAANSWAGTAPTGGNGWSETPASTANYFQFTLDTSNYNGVTVAFNTNLLLNGDWASPLSNIYINTSADGAPFVTYAPYPQAAKGGWTTGLTAAAAATGTGTTVFRFSSDGASKDAAVMYLDDIIFKGCQRPDPLTITKNFAQNPVQVGGTSTLNFTIVNPNAGYALTGVTVTDTFPAGVTVASPLTTTNTCNGSLQDDSGGLLAAADPGIKLTAGTMVAGGTCTFSVLVTVADEGPHNNVSGFVESTETGKNNTSTGIASDSITAVLPPEISKQFAPNPILEGAISTLTFAITNPNQNNSLSGVAVTDTFPAGLTVAAPLTTTNTCGGSLLDDSGGALAAADPGIRLTGGTISANSTCFFSVDVTSPTQATYANTSGNISHIINAVPENGNTASDSLIVITAYPSISLLKQVGSTASGPWSSFLPMDVGGNVYYRFTLENTGDVALTSVNVTDPHTAVDPSGCVWRDPLPVPVSINDNHIDTCVIGPVTAVSGSNPNTATGHGTYIGTVNSSPSTATYATPALTIVKSAAENNFTAVDDVLNYSYLVTNSGFAPLVGPITVADDKSTDENCPDVNTVGDFDNFLDPGEAITCTATYTIIAADVTAKEITNIASATGGSVTSPTDTLTVPLAPDLTAIKVNDASGTAPFPGTFDWTITVTNVASAGSAFFLDTNTMLTDDLPDTGPTYAVGTVTKTAGVAGTINCSITSDTLTCAASGDVTIPPADSFSVPVTVTPDAAGTLENPRSGGTCAVDPGAGVLNEIDETNNDCSDSVEVGLLPNIAFSKTVVTYSDPINGTTDPKYIPGCVVEYSLLLINSGAGAVDDGTLIITDPISANTELYVDSYGSCGPVDFIDGTPLSGLSCTFTDLTDLTDDVNFSDETSPGPYTYDYVPVSTGGFDTNVTSIEISPKSQFNGTGGGDPSFQLKFRTKVQ